MICCHILNRLPKGERLSDWLRKPAKWPAQRIARHLNDMHRCRLPPVSGALLTTRSLLHWRHDQPLFARPARRRFDDGVPNRVAYRLV
jgi:hypothetical protein